jgi:glutamate/aspartate transport system substrate-binding protein
MSKSLALEVCLTAVLLFAGLIAPAHAQRIALVIGNAAYTDKPLRNPVNDALDMAAELRRAGFQVMSYTNLNRRDFNEAIRQFTTKALAAQMVVVYYSGHGMQAAGENYLIPVDARIRDEREVRSEGIALKDILVDLDDANVQKTVVILDACRDNPFVTRGRSARRGLARVEVTGNATVIAFATADGKIADDGVGRNGVYTAALLQQLQGPVQDIRDLLDETANAVAKQTRDQKPKIYGDTGAFKGIYLASAAPTAKRQEPEEEAWLEVKDSQSIAQLEAFLALFKNGRYAARVTTRLAGLRASGATGGIAPEPIPLAGTVAKMKKLGSITMGVRNAAGVLSYRLAHGNYVGFHIDVCHRIIEGLAKTIGVTHWELKYVPVTSQDRLSMVENGTVDIECGSTTNNAARQRQVSFLSTLYVSEARIAVKSNSGIHSLSQLRGKRIAATTGTTSIQQLRKHKSVRGMDFHEIFGPDHGASFLLLESGQADAYVMDDMILAGLIGSARNPADYRIVGEAISFEPVGIMVRKDDLSFKKLADDTIADMLKTGELSRIYDRWFLQSIPPRSIRLNLPSSESTKAAWANPSDKPLEEYFKN